MVAEERKSFPGVPEFTRDHFGYGVMPDGLLFCRENGENGTPKVEWISDGYAHIVEEMRKENGDSVFIIEGLGAKDGHVLRFEISAYDFAEGRKLKGNVHARLGTHEHEN
jgi:hypothetical protein